MEARVPRHKSFYILPNLFTTASMFLGFMGILWAADGLYDRAAVAIMVCLFMDGIDGKVARLTGTSTEFGIQFDSLADLVSFGVCPALLMYTFTLKQFGKLGIAVAFLFTVCAALRLARFNVTTSVSNKRFFSGLPSPPAGCALACLVFFLNIFPSEIMDGALPAFCLVYTACIGLLMVSNIRYASFKEFGVFKAHPFRSVFLFAIVPFALIVANPRVFCLLITLAYIVSGLFHTFIILPRLSRAANRAAERHANEKDASENQQ